MAPTETSTTENTSITASFRWTVDELQTAHSMHAAARSMRIPRLLGIRRFRTVWPFRISLTDILSGLLAFIALLHLVLAVIRGTASSLGVTFTLSLLLAAGFRLGILWSTKATISRRFRKMPSRDKLCHYSANPDGVEVETEDQAQGFRKWSAYAKVVRTPQGFLLYPTEQIFNWLLNHAFSSMGEADALGEMAHQYAPSYSDFTS